MIAPFAFRVFARVNLPGARKKIVHRLFMLSAPPRTQTNRVRGIRQLSRRAGARSATDRGGGLNALRNRRPAAMVPNGRRNVESNSFLPRAINTRALVLSILTPSSVSTQNSRSFERSSNLAGIGSVKGTLDAVAADALRERAGRGNFYI